MASEGASERDDFDKDEILAEGSTEGKFLKTGWTYGGVKAFTVNFFILF